MTILDDARAGHEPRHPSAGRPVRPRQRRWLDETEIPADRSSWGPFVQLADTAEAAGAPDHRGPARPPTRPSLSDDARKIGDLFACFMDEARHRQARAAPGQAADRRGRRAARRARPGGVPRRVRAGRRRTACSASYVNTDDRNSDRYLFNLVQGGLGLPDESYYRDDKFADDPRGVRRLPRDAARPGRARGPGRRRSEVLDDRHPAGAGPLGARRDPRRPEDLQPDDRRRAQGAVPGLRLGRLRHQPRRRRRDHRRDVRAAAVVPRAPDRVLERGRHRGLEDLAALPRAALRRAVPHRRLRRGQLRLLRPHPQRHPRAARAVEARRRARRGRDRRGGRRGVRRPALPAAGEGADGRAGREPARGLPPSIARARLDERGDQAAGLREARHVPARRSATPRSSATTPSSQVSPDDLLGNVAAAAAFETDRQLGKIGVAGRPRRVVHAAADRQRLLQPRHQRDLLPGRDPAAAVLQPRRRRGRELRRHRRGDRPRDRPRLRRPGRAVRRRRQPQRLVDAPTTRRRSR